MEEKAKEGACINVDRWHKCFCPTCNKTAIFRDWAGWEWCLRHTLREFLCPETYKWLFIKRLEVVWWENKNT